MISQRLNAEGILTNYKCRRWLLGRRQAAGIRPHLGSRLGKRVVDIAQHGLCRVQLRVEEHQMALDLEGI